MKIYGPQNYQYSYTPLKAQTSFTSLKLKNDENDFSDTCFYRDIPTLLQTTKLLKENFPNGTTIMDFAASNGEEAISLYSLLNHNNNNKYTIYGYDKSDRAVNLGKKGIYTVFSEKSNDYFLIPECHYSKQINDKYGMIKELRRCFSEVMEPTVEPNYQINDPHYIKLLQKSPYFQLKYFKIKDEVKDKIKIEKGDINNIQNLLPERKVGAIMFRNAMYIETGNYAINDFSLNEDLNINKKEIIEKIVNKVYDKLLPGGLFIIGDIEKDHIYIADNHVKDKDKYFIRNYGVAICKQPLLWNALEKDDRFEPVFYKKVDSPCALREDIKVPTIWRKK